MRVAVGEKFAARYAAEVARRGLPVEFIRHRRDVGFVDDTAGVEAAIYAFDGYTERFIDDVLALPGLRWMHTEDAGTDRPLYDRFRARGLTVSHSPGANAPEVAEWAMALMLAHAKQLSRWNAQQAERIWKPGVSQMLLGSNVLVIGLGAIGTRVAKIARGFGMHVLGMRKSKKPCDNVDEVYALSDFVAVAPRADFVVIAVPLTDETRGIIGKAELEAMKTEAALINVARGAVVDERELLAQLDEGKLAAALLDAFVDEPLPKSSPFWNHPRVTVTPHTAYLSKRYMDDVFAIFRDNVARHMQGKPLHAQVI